MRQEQPGCVRNPVLPRPTTSTVNEGALPTIFLNPCPTGPPHPAPLRLLARLHATPMTLGSRKIAPRSDRLAPAPLPPPSATPPHPLARSPAASSRPPAWRRRCAQSTKTNELEKYDSLVSSAIEPSWRETKLVTETCNSGEGIDTIKAPHNLRRSGHYTQRGI